MKILITLFLAFSLYCCLYNQSLCLYDKKKITGQMKDMNLFSSVKNNILPLENKTVILAPSCNSEFKILKQLFHKRALDSK